MAFHGCATAVLGFWCDVVAGFVVVVGVCVLFGVDLSLFNLLSLIFVCGDAYSALWWFVQELRTRIFSYMFDIASKFGLRIRKSNCESNHFPSVMV